MAILQYFKPNVAKDGPAGGFVGLKVLVPAHDLTVYPPARATMLASGLRRNLNRYKTIWKQHPVPTIAKTTRQKIDSVQNEINGKVGKRELHCSKEGEKSLEPFHLHLFIPSSKSEVSGKNKYCPVWDELIWEEEMNVWHLLLPRISPVDLSMCSV